MKFEKRMTLKNGMELLLRNAGPEDAQAVLEVFTKTHGETDFLLTYPEENTFGIQEEAAFLRNKEESEKEIELLAFADGRLAGSAGIEAVGSRCKIRHRAEFGIAVLKEFWGLGIGRNLTESCIACAGQAGFAQLELNAAAENERALALYRSLGFTEFGRNPKGFCSRHSGFQELVYMRLELLKPAEEKA